MYQEIVETQGIYYEYIGRTNCLFAGASRYQPSMSRYENNVYDPKSEILTKLCEILHTNADFLLGMSCDYHMPKASMEMSAADKKLWLLYQQLSPEDKIRVEERILTLAESHSK